LCYACYRYEYDVDQHVTCHASARREREEHRRACREARATKDVVQAPRRRAGRPRRAVGEDEPQPNPDYEENDVEHHAEDDAEAMEEDAQQWQQRRGKKVVEPDPDLLDDYSGGPHDITLLTRYHVHVARKAAEGVVRINVI